MCICCGKYLFECLCMRPKHLLRYVWPLDRRSGELARDCISDQVLGQLCNAAAATVFFCFIDFIFIYNLCLTPLRRGRFVVVVVIISRLQ
jgi:hypothetical protein